ncbi:hypothetical protein [Hymenobacter sp. BRD67]|uniref:hypothetical protein n=1 Tax=Hymenobacter sp. BRD67 TaxID=2675877 RepID=UPI0015675D1F|nr:hypothetical protein [Hymenobacter sp. BRD67]QKG54072.1 hypothetical protein GKZ67_17545 [Hymenobacter sp. BRD67]
MRYRLLFLSCLASLLLVARFSRAQQPALPTDVLLLTSGQEIRCRVLTITPDEVSYLPRPDSVSPASARPDTLHLPVATVFLVRYANGTHEVLAAHSPSVRPGTEPLVGLSRAQRQQLGRLDAQRYYHQSGPYWAAFGTTLYLGPLLGLAPTIGISSVPVRARNLAAPPLLADADYAHGYQQQANRRKRGRTWAGYGTATGVYVVLFAALLASLSH